MDIILTLAFYFCAGLAVAGALAAAIASGGRRSLGLLILALGTAGLLASLSAGFAALVALVCLGGSALLVGGLGEDGSGVPVVLGRRALALSAQLGGLAAAFLFALLAYVAWQGDFAHGAYPGGSFGAAALGRRLFAHDALAADAAGALLMVGLAWGLGLVRRR